jgi:hypothetical protein
VENPDLSSSSKEQEGENSILDKIAEMERLKQVPFDDEKGFNYMHDDSFLHFSTWKKQISLEIMYPFL